MTTLAANLSTLLRWPVGCPLPASRKLNENRAKTWLQSNQGASSLEKTSYSSYLGVGTAVVGLATLFLGRDNSIVKTIGGVLAAVGTAVALLGKLFGFEFSAVENAVNSVVKDLQKKVVVGDAGTINKPIGDEDVSIKTKDVELKGGFFKSPIPTKKTIIYIHGVRSNIEKCEEEIRKIQEKLPVNILAVDPRGFGNSKYSGVITTEGLIEDGKAMYDYLVNEKGIDPKDISVFGHSLGGAIAVGLAKEREVENLILQSTFTKTSQAAEGSLKKLLPDVLATQLSKLLNTDFNSGEDIKKVKAKNLVVLHGEKDIITPSSEGKDLFELSKQNPNIASREWISQPEADHSDYFNHYTDENFDLIRRLLGVESTSEEVSSVGRVLPFDQNIKSPNLEQLAA